MEDITKDIQFIKEMLLNIEKRLRNIENTNSYKEIYHNETLTGYGDGCCTD